MRALHAEVLYEGATVSCLLRDAQRAIRGGASGEPAPVVHDQLIPFRKRRLCKQRGEGVRDMAAMHQHDRFSSTSDLVLQFRSINPYSIHAYAPFSSSFDRTISRPSRLLWGTML